MEHVSTINSNALRGAVMTKFNSITSFANAMGWDRKKASRIINFKQRPSAKEMEQMAICLDVQDVCSFVLLFLPSLATKWHEHQIKTKIADIRSGKRYEP